MDINIQIARLDCHIPETEIETLCAEFHLIIVFKNYTDAPSAERKK